VLGGFVVAVFGLLPRYATGLSWAVLAVCIVLGWVGELLQLPQPVLDLSPFGHIPAVPAEDVTAMPVIALTTLAVMLALVGVVSFRRRDLVDR
jgi:ABC-2 type transport system permease protein